jgi:hypothetical protein
MDDQDNYDPGIVNTIVDKVRDRDRGGDPDEESMIGSSKGAVDGLAMGGMGHGDDAAMQSSKPVAGEDMDADNAGNFGSIRDIESDNRAVQNAEGGIDGEALAEGPANTDPNIAAGMSGV